MKSRLSLVLYGLPAWLIVHAVGFWNRGVVDKEAMSFILNYLADRPLLAAVFDPRLNDWGAYQAREFSYLLDLIDARVFAVLLSRGVLFFIPFSGVVGLLALAGIFLYGARTVLRLHRVVAILVLSVFLSSIVTQASTAYFYRSAKMLVSVVLMGFLFALTSALGSVEGEDRGSVWRLGGIFALGVMMSLCDRQGFYLLGVATAGAGLLWLSAVWRARSSETRRRAVALTCLSAVATSAVYNYLIAPTIIHWANGYWPSFAYQTLPWSSADVGPLLQQAFAMFRAQVSFFSGNLPFAVVCLMVGTLGVAAASTRRSTYGRISVWTVLTSEVTIVVLVSSLSLVGMLAGMILRQPPVIESFWYDTLSFQAAFLFSAAFGLTAFEGVRSGWARIGIPLVLLLMVIGNVRQHGPQRQFMAINARWFNTQHARSVEMANEFAAREGRGDGEGQVSWVHLSRAGATVELPIQSDNFLDNVQLAYATLRRRPPLGDAEGPYWWALHAFLVGSNSPLRDSQQIGPAISAFRSIGIRRVTLDRKRYTDPDLAQTTATALTASAQESHLWDDGGVLTVDLGDGEHQQPRERGRILAPSTYTVTTSRTQDRLAPAFDGDPVMQRARDGGQSGDEWIRITFDRTRDVARIRMTLENALGTYPRAFLIEAVDGRQVQTLYQGSPLAGLMRGLLVAPPRPPIDIALSPNHSRTLFIRMTHPEVLFWSLPELEVWERS